ncbi:MAG: DUF6261 family protein [Paludibacter sp.]
MNEVFLTVPYSRMRYLDFPGFVNDTVTIAAKYNVADLFIEGPYNRLLAIKTELNELEVTYRKQPKTDELAELRTTSGIMIDTVLRLLKNLNKAGLASQAEMLKLVTPFLERYMSSIQDSDTELKRELIRQLGKNFDDNDVVKQALESLGLKLFVDELRTVQSKIEETQNEKIELLSKNILIDKRELTLRAIATLKNFFHAIELGQLDHADLDYSALINELNKFMSVYTTSLRTRITIQKKALAAKKEEATKKTTVPTPTSDAVA